MVVVFLAVSFVDDFGGDVNGRERREDEGLKKTREEGEQKHRDLRGDPAAERHELFDDVIFAEDVSEEAERERQRPRELADDLDQDHERSEENTSELQS